jgi:hypothetical protein
MVYSTWPPRIQYPSPWFFLIGRDGKAFSKFAEEGYMQKPDLKSVLEAARNMGTVQKSS